MIAPVRDDSLARLVRGLDLEGLENDRFRAETGHRGERLYGGLLLAQALIAAGRTAGGRQLHSLHAYFVRPGRPKLPLEFVVERLRDGAGMSARRAVGRQAGNETIALLASFADHEPGARVRRPGRRVIEHEEPMPDAPSPDGLPDWEDLRAAGLGDPSKRRTDVAVEVRVCDPEPFDPAVRRPPRWRVWIRPRGVLPDDPLLHAATLVFASDRTLLRVATRPHAPSWSVIEAASVDHAFWLHRPARFDDWVLYVCESPVAGSGRALAFGAMYARDGRRIASVAQEGVIRLMD